MTPMPAELNSKARARKVVAVLESEPNSGLAGLIHEQGGSPLPGPAVPRTLYAELEEVRTLLDELCADRYEVVLFMTGNAVSSLFELARELGREPALASSLRKVTTVCRGPKASAALRSLGFEQTRSTHQPLSNAREIQALVALVPAGRAVLRLNGDARDSLAEKLLKRRARLRDVWLTHRRSATDVRAAVELVQRIVAGRVDALLVTCELQFRHLYQVARRLDLGRELVQALRKDVLVATLSGPCQAVAEAHGVRPHVMPAHPKLLALALMRFLDKPDGERAAPSPHPS